MSISRRASSSTAIASSSRRWISARARLISLLAVPVLFLRSCALTGTTLVLMMLGVLVVVAIALWSRMGRRTIELDPERRQIRVRTRGEPLKSESLEIDFDRITRCSTVAIGDAVLWNVDTRDASLTLCVVRDEYDAARLSARVRARWPESVRTSARSTSR